MAPPESLSERLIAALPAGSDTLFNPWRQHCQFDAQGNGPDARRRRLAMHLDCSPRFILVGEAPGYQGARYFGVAFTSERLVLEGAIPRVPQGRSRLSSRDRPFSEPSATIVWRQLYRLGIAESTVLWNALQLHPMKPGNPWSNRTPTDAELRGGERALRLLLEVFPAATVLCVGRKAEQLLADMRVASAGTLRHPANGGATQFAEGLAAAVAAESSTSSKVASRACNPNTPS